tara:strand:+ start:8470 stop:10287 length:1818 start_codon:yes stop_codon:yes gene_type:complete
MIRKIYTQFFKNNWKLYIVYSAAFIAIPIRQIMIPHYYGKIIDKLKAGLISDSARLLVVLLFVWIAVQFLSLAKEKVHSIMWPKFNYFAQETIFTKILDSYDNNFEELRVGEVLTKLIKLPWILDNIQDEVGLLFINHILITASNIIYLTYNSKYLGLFYIISVLIYYIVARRFISGCKHYKVESERQYDYSHGYIEDVISNLLTVYSSNRKNQEINNVHNINQKNIKVEINRQYCNLKYKLIFSILNIFVFIGLNGIAMYLFKLKRIKIQNLVSVFILTFSILNTLIMYYDSSKSVVAIMGDMKYIKGFLDELPESDDTNEHFGVNLNNTNMGLLIQLNNVSYTIGDRTIYDNLNLTINRNESVLVTGPIGCGKSTFAKLLVKLIKPNNGKILINNQDIKLLSSKYVRNNIIYIPQSPILFDRTLWENISYGLNISGPGKKITKELLWKLMDEIGLHDLKDIFKNKIDQSVGKRGSNLSGGQRQIVWILRSLLSDVKVIILDEPTSALDKCVKQSIIDILKYINNRNKQDSTTSSTSIIEPHTLIIITHDTDAMKDLEIDTTIKFNNGKAIKCKEGNVENGGTTSATLNCENKENVCPTKNVFN